jgi:uncharacterized protein (TIGR02271 family)
MGKNIVGVYDSRDEVIEAVTQLTGKGYNREDISIYSNGEATDYLEYNNNVDGTRGVEREEESFFDKIKNAFTDEGLSSYSTTEDRLKGIGVPERVALDHASDLDNGRIAVIVEDDTNNEIDGSKLKNGYSEGFNDDEEREIKLREEQLDVQKNTVQSGEVEISKKVESHEETVHVPVKKEEVYIEHKSVDNDDDLDGRPIDDGENIRIPIREEKLEVTKKPVVTDEIVIGKRTVEETERVSDTVKKEDLLVDGEDVDGYSADKDLDRKFNKDR